MEWGCSLPHELKLKGQTGKYIFKKALERTCRTTCCTGPRWFRGAARTMVRGSLKQRVKDSLLGPAMADSGLFDMGFVSQLVEEHQSGRVITARAVVAADVRILPAPVPAAGVVESHCRWKSDLWPCAYFTSSITRSAAQRLHLPHACHFARAGEVRLADLSPHQPEAGQDRGAARGGGRLTFYRCPPQEGFMSKLPGLGQMALVSALSRRC